MTEISSTGKDLASSLIIAPPLVWLGVWLDFWKRLTPDRDARNARGPLVGPTPATTAQAALVKILTVDAVH
ncbi:MAG: hypothetical protein IH901_01750 [Proteobacteria bacterium]|nr:hypothetical protein [Pseudomonadota bacterium]